MPYQTRSNSRIGCNLGVLLNNNVKYKLFLRQTILTDCQIRNSARLVWSGMRQTACWMVTSYAAQAYRQSAHSPTAQASTHSIRHSLPDNKTQHSLQQPPPRPNCLCSTCITTGNSPSLSASAFPYQNNQRFTDAQTPASQNQHLLN